MPKRKNISDESLVIEDIKAMLELFSAFPLSCSKREEGFLLLNTGTDSALENYALILPAELKYGNDDELREKIKDALEFFGIGDRQTSHRIPHFWPIFPGTPTLVEEILDENGLELTSEFTGMVLDLHASISTEQDNAVVQLSRESSPLPWANATWRGFDSEEDAGESFVTLISQAITSPDIQLLSLLDEETGRTAATGMLCTAHEMAGIYYVATVPEFRKRGYAKRIMNALIRKAIELDFDRVCLLATPDGVPLYEKCGFRKVCPVRIRQFGE